MQTDVITQTENGIKTLLNNLDTQKQSALEDKFIQLKDNFKEIFGQIVPNGTADLQLVSREAVDVSQNSHPSQFQPES